MSAVSYGDGSASAVMGEATEAGRRTGDSERGLGGGLVATFGTARAFEGEARQAGGVAPMRAGGERVPLVLLAPGGRRLASAEGGLGQPAGSEQMGRQVSWPR